MAKKEETPTAQPRHDPYEVIAERLGEVRDALQVIIGKLPELIVAVKSKRR